MSECASCGFENRPGALFCGSCGEQLGRACPACGEVVALELAFCTRCGSAMAPGEVEPAILEERKVVSVLFADLVGFTGRAEKLDPEDVRRMLSPYHARVKAELESYGGTVEKFIGDAVVALFGAPLAHEDDPERAVRAALAARDALGELNAADPTLGLHVRIGVTTGEAMIALSARPKEGEGMATGDVVNTCSRLQSAAPVDGILVDEATYRATSAVIEYRDAEPVHAKGKSEPVPVWEVVAPRTRLGVDIAFKGGAELVGRADGAPAPPGRRHARGAGALAAARHARRRAGDRQEPPALRAVVGRSSPTRRPSPTGARDARSPTARASASGRSARW